ncbi:MAG: hypothetical protein IKT38_01835 [Clostridia bacterium]|nr:hypothetical protein [Clostridia bacterium]
MKTNVLSTINDCPTLYNEAKSPFAVYDQEQLVKIHTTSDTAITSTNNEIDKLLIFAVSQLKCTTSFILETVLHNCGIDEITQKDVQKRLKILSACEFIDAYRFEENNKAGTRSSNKVYILGWRGAGLLKSYGKKVRLGNYLKTIDATQVKKILSASQFLIRSGFDINEFSMCEPVFVPSKKQDAKATKIFRPQGLVNINGAETIFIESVKQNSGWKKELLDKLERIATVSMAKEHNISFCKHNTSLLLIAENTEHMKKLMRFVEAQYICFPIKIAYSADTLIYADPKNCIFSIKPNFFASLFSA